MGIQMDYHDMIILKAKNYSFQFKMNVIHQKESRMSVNHTPLNPKFFFLMNSVKSKFISWNVYTTLAYS